MNALKLKKGDTVQVIAGKDSGKQGKILSTQAETGKVVVEGINVATVHTKPRKQGEQGGIIKREAALYACKVMLVCPKCHKTTRIGIKVAEDGTKTRVCKRCANTI